MTERIALRWRSADTVKAFAKTYRTAHDVRSGCWTACRRMASRGRVMGTRHVVEVETGLPPDATS